MRLSNIKNMLKTLVIVSLVVATPVFAEEDAAIQNCVKGWKEHMKPSANAKTQEAFATHFCQCAKEATKEGEKPSDEIVSKCMSRVLVIDTIVSIPDDKGPNDTSEMGKLCVDSVINDIGDADTSKEDAGLKKYCACAAPKIYGLKDDKSGKDEMHKKILDIGDQCAEALK